MIIASATQSRKLNELRDELDSLEKVILFESSNVSHPKNIVFNDVLTLGQRYLQTSRDDFERMWKSVQPSDHANPRLFDAR